MVAAAVISDSSGNIILAATQKLYFTDVLLGETTTTLLASRLASTTGCGCLALEGGVFMVILAVNQPHFFFFWQFTFIVSDIILYLSSFQSVYRCVNYRAHLLVKWVYLYCVW